jgi:hypothetical protein
VTHNTANAMHTRALNLIVFLLQGFEIQTSNKNSYGDCCNASSRNRRKVIDVTLFSQVAVPLRAR